MDRDLELLKKLSEADGASAHENEVRKIMKDEFLKYVKESDISYGGLGSIIAKKGNDGPKIMIAAHMDEVGFIVREITKDGFIKFQADGDWWSQVMLAQEMTITTRSGKKVHGVTGSIPPHVLTEKELKNPVDMNDLYIDLGVTSFNEAVALGINIGDMITPTRSFKVMNNENYLLGKALDNRAGCAALIRVLEELENVNHPNTIYAVGTVQEELGFRGAEAVTKSINPDIAIAFDTSIAKDMPGADGLTKIGNGPALLIYDRCLVGHVALRNLFEEVAGELNIPFQYDYIKSGTDAGAMSLSGDGAPTISFCIETRYIHSHTSVIHRKDYENAIKLIVEVVKRLDSETVNRITYDE